MSCDFAFSPIQKLVEVRVIRDVLEGSIGVKVFFCQTLCAVKAYTLYTRWVTSSAWIYFRLCNCDFKKVRFDYETIKFEFEEYETNENIKGSTMPTYVSMSRASTIVNICVVSSSGFINSLARKSND